MLNFIYLFFCWYRHFVPRLERISGFIFNNNIESRIIYKFENGSSNILSTTYILKHFEITLGFIYNAFEAKTVNLPRREFGGELINTVLLTPVHLLHKIDDILDIVSKRFCMLWRPSFVIFLVFFFFFLFFFLVFFFSFLQI